MVFKKSVKSLNAIFLLFFGLFIIFISGCEKKESVKEKPQRITGPCEVLDRIPEDLSKPLDVNFGGRIKLSGITTSRVSPDKLKVTYFWQIINETDSYNEAFVHFTDRDNKVLFQNDHDLCQRRPFSELKGKFIKEPYVIEIPTSTVGKDIYIKVGIYAPDLERAPRLKIESAGGVPTDDDNTRAIVEKLTL